MQQNYFRITIALCHLTAVYLWPHSAGMKMQSSENYWKSITKAGGLDRTTECIDNADCVK